MQLRFSPIFLVFAALLGTCCSEEELVQPTQEQMNCAKVLVQLPGASKTALGERDGDICPVLWSAGDRISIGGTPSHPLTEQQAGMAEAEFAFAGSVRAPYNILYPATEQAASVSFPAVQTYVASSFDPAAAPMYSASESFGNAELRHLGSLLKVSLRSPDAAVTLQQILVSSMGGEALSGEFALETDGKGLFTGEFSSRKGSTSTTLMTPAVILGSSPLEFHIGLPHGDFSRGLSLLAISEDGKVMSLGISSGHPFRLPAGKIVEFEPVDFKSGENILLIRDIASLKALAEAPAEVNAYLLEDLDLSDVSWTSIDKISARLDGAGHTLKGLKAPLCRELYGSIRNLNIEADIDCADGLAAAAFALKLSSKAALIENCTAGGRVCISNPAANAKVLLGGIAASNRWGTIRSCSSIAELTLDRTLSAKDTVDVGGIAAYSVGLLENCTASGKIFVRSGAKIGYYLSAGGAAGTLEGKADGLYSDAVVEVESGVSIAAANARMHIGGVIGYHIGSETLSDITSGATVITASAATMDKAANAIGAVIGKNNYGKLDASIRNTTLSGVRVTVPDAAMNMGIGGIVGYSYNAADGVAMEGLVNNASVEVTFTPASSLDVIAIGGVSGIYYYNINGHSATLSACENRADVVTRGAPSPAATDIVNGVRLGGVFGHCQITGSSADNILTIQNCRNSAAVKMLESDGGRYCFEGGVLSTAWSADVRILSCTNDGPVSREGFTNLFYMGGIMAHHYRTGPGKLTVEDCVNNATVALYDGKGQNLAEVAAGGILGMVSAKGSNTLDFAIRRCTNNGSVDRLTEAAAAASKNSFGGGILGGMGKSHSTGGYDVFSSALIEECTNSGRVIFNQYKGPGTFIEKTTNNSFTGGIVGCSRSSSAKVLIRNCSNSGDISGTSGFHGGIAGFLVANSAVCGEKTSDGVRYCINSGNIGKVSDTDLPSTLGSGYNICGGIVGYLKNQTALKNSIQYCWNDGNVFGSTQDISPCAGGIVGKLLEAGVVSHCKNSGKVRNYKSAGRNGLLYSGAISGNVPQSGEADYYVSYCGVGGCVYRTSGWTQLGLDGPYPWQNYIYSNTSLLDDGGNPSVQYPPETYYQGCYWWDGTSKLPWEE